MSALVQVDAHQLQREWDAEADRERFAALREVIRNRPAGEPHPLIGGALVFLLAVVCTLLLVAIGGAA